MRPPARAARLFGSLLCLSCIAVSAAAEGVVDYVLEWGTSRRSYTCVFSGTVTCAGRPCEAASIEVNVLKEEGEAVSGTATPDEKGFYQVEMAIEGHPDESARWVLLARPSYSVGSPVEVGGRMILMADRPVITVQRAIVM